MEEEKFESQSRERTELRFIQDRSRITTVLESFSEMIQPLQSASSLNMIVVSK